MFRVLTSAKPVDEEEERLDWEQSFDIIPDFDFSEFDKESDLNTSISADFSLSDDEEA